jgi:hypothetical protein
MWHGITCSFDADARMKTLPLETRTGRRHVVSSTLALVMKVP